MTWSEFLTEARGSKFKSAREFCTRCDLGVSYPQYSRYEAGDQIPGLEVVLKLEGFLGFSLAEGIRLWLDAQVSADAHKTKLARALPKETAPQMSVADAVKPDTAFVFNRSHRKLFERSPIYRDLFNFINAFGTTDAISAQSVAQGVGIAPELAQTMLSDLAELGVIVDDGEGFRAGRRVFYFPENLEFFEMRRRNLTHNFEKVLGSLTLKDLNARKGYRQVITRDLTQRQVEELVRSLDALAHDVVMAPDENADTVYSLCLVLGSRFSRIAEAAQSSAPGLVLGKAWIEEDEVRLQS